MAEERFQVTRSGREIYAGGLDGLVEAAAQGRIRANDLVFDPDNDRWLFARNLPALAGFALRGRQARGTEDHSRPGPITLDRLSLERRDQRRKRVLQALALLTVIGLTLALVRMVPTGGDKRQYSEFIETRDRPPDATLTQSGGSASGAGQGASAGGRPGGGAPGAGDTAAPTRQVEPGEATAAGRPADPEAPAADVMADPGAARRPVAPPAELVFDYARRDAPGVFVEPTAEERVRYAARYTAEGMRALNDPRPPPGDARLAQLLAARHRAEFARLNLEALDPEHPDLPQVDRLIEELEAAFDAVCKPAYGDRFCALKLQYPDWPDPVVERVAGGRVEVGMSAEQAREAWGRPTRFRREGEGRRYCYDFLCERSLRVVDQIVVEVGG